MKPRGEDDQWRSISRFQLSLAAAAWATCSSLITPTAIYAEEKFPEPRLLRVHNLQTSENPLFLSGLSKVVAHNSSLNEVNLNTRALEIVARIGQEPLLRLYQRFPVIFLVPLEEVLSLGVDIEVIDNPWNEIIGKKDERTAFINLHPIREQAPGSHVNAGLHLLHEAKETLQRYSQDESVPILEDGSQRLLSVREIARLVRDQEFRFEATGLLSECKALLAVLCDEYGADEVRDALVRKTTDFNVGRLTEMYRSVLLQLLSNPAMPDEQAIDAIERIARRDPILQETVKDLIALALVKRSFTRAWMNREKIEKQVAAESARIAALRPGFSNGFETLEEIETFLSYHILDGYGIDPLDESLWLESKLKAWVKTMGAKLGVND